MSRENPKRHFTTSIIITLIKPLSIALISVWKGYDEDGEGRGGEGYGVQVEAGVVEAG